MSVIYDPKYDLDRDGKITQNDINIFKSYLNTYVDQNDPVSVQADFDGNRVIDEFDYSDLLYHVGTLEPYSKPGSRLLPNPFTGGLVFLAAVGLVKAFKKR